MRAIHTPDYYQFLDLSPSATAADIKSRYRALSKQHHPDKGGNQAEMAKINQAYAVLSDPFKRNIHDAERRRHLQMSDARSSQRQSAAHPATAARQRRPAPRSDTRFAAPARTRKRAGWWWPKIAFGLASLIIVAGILLHLPIAEAMGTVAESDAQPQVQTLNVTYPPDAPASTHLVTNPATDSTSPTTEAKTTPQQPTETEEDNTPSTSKQKLQTLCSLASRNRQYNTEHIQSLCRPYRSEQ